MSAEDLRSVRRFYDSLRDGSIEHATTLLHPEAVWSADGGCPRPGTYESVEAVLHDVLIPLVRDWDGLAVNPFVFLEQDGDIVVVGHMHGTGPDGERISSRFADRWEVRAGKLSRCERTTEPELVARLSRGRPLIL